MHSIHTNYVSLVLKRRKAIIIWCVHGYSGQTTNQQVCLFYGKDVCVCVFSIHVVSTQHTQYTFINYFWMLHAQQQQQQVSH